MKTFYSFLLLNCMAFYLAGQSVSVFSPVFESPEYIKSKKIKSIAYKMIDSNDGYEHLSGKWVYDRNGYVMQKIDTTADQRVLMNYYATVLNKKGQPEKSIEKHTTLEKVSGENYHYDSEGRLIEKINETGIPYIGDIRTVYTYKEGLLQTEEDYLKEGDQLIFVTRYHYNAQSNLDSASKHAYAPNAEKVALINKKIYAYDETGQLKSELELRQGKDTLGYKVYNKKQQLMYSAEIHSSQRDMVVGVKDAPHEMLLIRTHYQYEDERLVSETVEGAEMKYSYDDQGQVIQLATKNRQLGYTVDYKKENEWLVATTILLGPDPFQNKIGLKPLDTLEIVRTKPTAAGKIEVSENKQFSKSSGNRFIVTKKRNSKDQLLEVSKSIFKIDEFCETSYSYEKLFKVETQVCFQGNKKIGHSPGKAVYSSSYDSNGNLIKEVMETKDFGEESKLEKNYVLEKEYNEAGNLMSTTNYFFPKPGDTTVSKWKYFYEEGKLIKAGLVSKNPKAKFLKTEEYKYEKGRRVKVVTKQILQYSGKVGRYDETFYNENEEIETTIYYNEQGQEESRFKINYNRKGEIESYTDRGVSGETYTTMFVYQYYD